MVSGALLFGLLTLVPLPRGGPPAARFDVGAPVEVEFRYARSGQPLVRARIDGRDAGWFMFDTGSAGHVIDRRAARRFELEVVGRVLSKNPSNEIRTRALGGRTLALGPATFAHPVFTELDLSSLDGICDPTGKAAGRGSQLAGVIGYDVFEHSVIELDYRAGRLALHDPELFDDEGLPWRPLVIRDDQPCIEATFEGHRELFLIDTGSDGAALFFTPAVRRLDLLQRATRPGRASNVGGTLSYRLGLIEDFELAGRRWSETSAQFSTVEDGAHAEIIPAGLIGCVVLDAFSVFLDCRGRRIAFVEHPVPKLGRDLLEEYAGLYQAKDGGVYELRRSKDRLYTPRDGGGRLWLVPVTETRLHAEDGLLRFEFVRDADGVVAAVSIGRPGGVGELATRRRGSMRLRRR
jgi:hypothetical protein